MSADEYDTPCKEAIETYFRKCIEFLFPIAAVEINWERGYNFLDKELQQVVRDAEFGQRFLDKLFLLSDKISSELIQRILTPSPLPEKGFNYFFFCKNCSISAN